MGVTSEYSTRVSTRELRPYFYCPVRPLDANNIFPGGRANRPILFFPFSSPPSRNRDRSDANSSDDLRPGSACFSTAAVYWSSQKRFGGKLQTFFSRSFSRSAFRNSAASIRPVDRDLFIRFAAR